MELVLEEQNIEDVPKGRKRKSRVSPIEKTNLRTNYNCPARISIRLNKEGLSIISKVCLDHSHPCDPEMAKLLTRNRKMTMHMCRVIERNDEAGVRTSKTYQVLVGEAGKSITPESNNKGRRRKELRVIGGTDFFAFARGIAKRRRMDRELRDAVAESNAAAIGDATWDGQRAQKCRFVLSVLQY
ncbi:hypothetical protein Ahy_B03g067432 [Arachis hypogaea]|uniref:FAR1 domain-containing protein n=1 Tax=Arachis hypogaea TaxID=3818 RepID=A0A445A736_ARAHY|nr:hypothetical protein Ahy_B03g067432 [Arachis hypogaea]